MTIIGSQMAGRLKSIFQLRRREGAAGDFNDGIAEVEKFGGELLTPNLRALRLTMTIADELLSMGVSAASVVSRALDVTEAYCQQPVHVDIISNMIIVSQLRGLEREPLTLMRPVVLRVVNNMTIQSIQHLVYQIRAGKLTLTKAEAEMERIIKKPTVYPAWLIPLANAILAAAVDLMFTTDWHIIVVTFIIVWLVDRLVLYLGKRSYTSFFRQAMAGGFVTLAAAAINALAVHGVSFFDFMNPTIIVVGGIIMLVAGLAFVGGIQDAIDEYFITASARILRVVMLTTGIVMGVLIGLYVARKAGIGITVNPNPLSLTALPFQIIGGAIAAGAFAIATQTRIRAVVWAAALGGLALAVLYIARNNGISIAPASGLAALAVGVLAKGFSRFWRTPASGSIACGIVPLVPGLSLYTAMMQLVNYPPGNPLFYRGIGSLFTAVAIALAIAAGASFGSMLARPLNQRDTQSRNLLPFADFMRSQLRADRGRRLASLILRRYRDPDDPTSPADKYGD